MRISLLLMAGVLCASVTFAQTDTVTLRVQRTRTQADGRVVLELPSGATVTVAASDLVGPPAAPAAADATLPAIADAQAGIRARCQQQWPNDFSVRAFCEKSQRDALTEIRARSMASPDQRTIRAECAKKWADDFSVRNFCEQTELKALQELSK